MTKTTDNSKEIEAAAEAEAAAAAAAEAAAAEAEAAAAAAEAAAASNGKVKFQNKKGLKFITTAKWQISSGKMTDPFTHITYSLQAPMPGDAHPRSWLTSQIEAGYIEVYK